jgi:thiol-disulfide isomerase/thioredoxin
MKLIKITAGWCMSCIVMNDLFDRVLSDYNVLFDVVSFDYDFDSELVARFNVGNVLPVYILLEDDREIGRVVGEVSKDKFVSFLMDNGGIYE